MIKIPTQIHGQRVVCVFPIISGYADTFVEADVVTTDEHGTFTIARFQPERKGLRVEDVIVVGKETRSFPDAIREARKAAGWG